MDRRQFLIGLTAAGSLFNRAYSAGLRPDPVLTVSEWADQYRELTSVVASEPGRWRTSRTPYLREIMDALSPSSPTETVALMKGAQIGATEAGNNWIGYVIDQAPGPMMVVLPTVETAKRWSKQRLAHLIAGTPVLRGRVADRRERDSGNTILTKEFQGGLIIITGANSGVGLRSMPARYMFFDEIDGYPGDVDEEGDPVELATKRSATFQRRKIFKVSTPKIKGLSRIEREFQAGTQEYYHLPCPSCGEFQALRFPFLRWPKEHPEAAAYECQACKQLIDARWKTQMLEAGKYVAENPQAGERLRTFHLSALYSPVGWKPSWGEIAIDFEAAREDLGLLQVFVNTVLGETWQQPGESPPDWEKLMGRQESYRLGQVPDGVEFLTAGADVQGTWLEGYVWGWGRNLHRWLVDHFRVERGPYDPLAWTELDARLEQMYAKPSGVLLPVAKFAIDTGYQGQHGTPVYAWARRHGASRVLAVDGRATGPPVYPPTLVDVKIGGQKLKHGCKLWGVNVSHWKSELYGRLNLPRPEAGETYPAGWVHFPADLPEEFYRQLTSEQFTLATRKGGGRSHRWEPIEGRRGEALDCAVYARAAAFMSGLDRHSADERWWARLGAAPAAVSAVQQQAIAATQPSVPLARQAAPEQRQKVIGRFSLI